MSPSDPNEPHPPDEQPLPTTPAPPAPPPPAAQQPVWSAPGWTPPYAPPVPPRRRVPRWGLIAALVIAGALFLFFVAAMVGGEGLASGPRVGLIEVKGTIGMGSGSVDSETVMKAIRRFDQDAGMKAVVVRIDSPGGAVAPSQEIYGEIRKLAVKKKVVCSMGSLAASGGFYVAMACPVIFAEPGTLTGSIGVITEFPNLKGIADRLSFKMEVIKSGKLKDAGNPFRDMSEDEREYWQALVLQVYEQFLGAVAEARHLPKDQVRPYADGRVLTGEQALKLKLIDKMGSLEDAAAEAVSLAGLRGEPHFVYPPQQRGHLLEQILGEAVHSTADAIRTEVKKQALAVDGPAVYYMAQ